MKKNKTAWAAAMIQSDHQNSYFGEYKTTPALFASKVLGTPEKMATWAASNFPNEDLEGVFRKIREEAVELGSAVSAYLGPWSTVEDFKADEALKVGDQLRSDLIEEAADVAIMALRLLVHIGADPYEAILDKWDIVEKRHYDRNGRKVEPNKPSEDNPEMIERSSKDDFVLGVPSYNHYWIAEEDGAYHWTRNRSSAKGFKTETDARSIIDKVEVLIETGEKVPLKDIPFLDVFDRNPKRFS